MQNFVTGSSASGTAPGDAPVCHFARWRLPRRARLLGSLRNGGKAGWVCGLVQRKPQEAVVRVPLPLPLPPLDCPPHRQRRGALNPCLQVPSFYRWLANR